VTKIMNLCLYLSKLCLEYYILFFPGHGVDTRKPCYRREDRAMPL